MNAETHKEFSGRVIKSEHAYTNQPREFFGPHVVVLPKNIDEVKEALQRAAGFTVRARSGTQVSRKNCCDASADVVLDLSEFRGISRSGDRVTVGAGVKAAELVEFLGEKNQVLPLSDNETKSVISDVLSEIPPLLVRSLGRLHKRVVSFQHVNKNGKKDTWQTAEHPDWRKRIQDEQLYVTELTFEPQDAAPLWIHAATVMRPAEQLYDELAQRVLSDSRDLTTIDFAIQSHYLQFDSIPMTTIVIAGNSAVAKIHKDHAREILESYIGFLREAAGEAESAVTELGYEIHSASGSDVYQAIIENGQQPSQDPNLWSDPIFHFISLQEKSSTALAGRVREEFFDTATGYYDRRVNVRIQAVEGLAAAQFGYDYKFPDDDLDKPPAGTMYKPDLSASLRRLYETFNQSWGHSDGLEHFRGQVYQQHDAGYESRTSQYSTKYSKGGHQEPYMFCEPLPEYEKDIAQVIELVKSNRSNQKDGINLVVRSGGHQYSGLSSGGRETVVLLMDKFTKFEPKEHPAGGGRKLVTVGSGVQVSTLYRKLREHKLILPGGQCPRVAVGGHVQTGGYGHFTRTLGLLLDYVYSFRIMLANGSIETISRPATAAVEFPLNDQLFRAVMGGSPGSFGVLLDYTFELESDPKDPQTRLYKGLRRYNFNRAKKMMSHMAAWSEGVAPDGKIPDGRDYTLTFASAGQRIPTAVMMSHLYLADSRENRPGDVDPMQDPEETVKSMRLNLPVVNAVCDPATKICYGLQTVDGDRLSTLIDQTVNRWPVISYDGREFRLPYVKRLNCSSVALTPGFVDGFCKLLEKYMTGSYCSGIKIVAQVGVLGGRYASPQSAANSAIAHRGAIVGFTFDVFHNKHRKSDAEAVQQKVQQFLSDENFHGDRELRMLWGTFGDVNLDNEETRGKYYPDDDAYRELQTIKYQVDKTDIFKTSFTIPPKKGH